MVLLVVKVSLPILVPGNLNNTKNDTRFFNLTASRAQGFTLLELLIVIVIAGILFSFATLAIRGSSPEDLIKKEAQRLHRLTQLVLEEAVLKNTEYGLEFKNNSYRFLSYNDGSWQAVSDDKLLRKRELPDEMEIELSIEQTDVIIGETAQETDDDNEYDEKEKLKPQIFLLSSEEITPEFSARFALPGIETSYTVVASADGKQEIQSDD